ncbi:MAG: HEAT repeat domain-containing protein, partial [Armatimonadetes bacterium]|nr:HEAT repeat domain-containing protein [Armatimonadota bacterium]
MDRSVQVMCQALGHLSAPVRDHAQAALLRIGEPAVLPLCDRLTGSQPEVRHRALLLLAELRDPRAAASLCRCVEDQDWQTRKLAVDALGKLGAPAIPALTALIRRTTGHDRWWAVDALGQTEAPEAAPILLCCLRAEDAIVRRQAALAFGRIGDPEFCPALVELTEDASPAVREGAALGLAGCGDGRAVASLTALLQDSVCQVRAAAGVALARLAEPESLSAVVAALKDDDSAVRWQAAVAISAILDQRPSAALTHRPTLHAAMPVLRRLGAAWSMEGGRQREAYLGALSRILTVTEWSNLPLPA